MGTSRHSRILFLILFLLQICTSLCGELSPMLTDGEFTQAVGIIESKLDEMPPDNGEASVLNQVVGEGIISYYTADDAANPIFVTAGTEDSGQKTIVLSRGEDHISHSTRNSFVVLVQKQGSEYSLHSVYVDDLEADTVIWADAIAIMVDGAEVVLELYGDTHDHNLDRVGPHCSWFGLSTLVCCINTLKEKAETTARKFGKRPGGAQTLPAEIGGNSQWFGGNGKRPGGAQTLPAEIGNDFLRGGKGKRPGGAQTLPAEIGDDFKMSGGKGKRPGSAQTLPAEIGDDFKMSGGKGKRPGGAQTLPAEIGDDFKMSGGKEKRPGSAQTLPAEIGDDFKMSGGKGKRPGGAQTLPAEIGDDFKMPEGNGKRPGGAQTLPFEDGGNENYMTMKMGSKSAAKGRSLGTITTYSKGPDGKRKVVDKRQTPTNMLPRYHPA